LTAAPVLLGTDGTKMSKSQGNAVELGASEDETARLIRPLQPTPSYPNSDRSFIRNFAIAQRRNVDVPDKYHLLS
jgi:tryptophanyl-tRNA synthetase